jgi:DNA-directed RNA polymerase subunit N (RpoN/RPB10)
LKRKSKSQTRKIQDELWQECRRVQSLRYPAPNTCFTCGRPIEGSNKQLGHFIPNSVGGALLRYNLDNLRFQCYYCNINLGGNGSEFYRKLVEEKGQQFVDDLFKLKHQTTNANDHYIKLLEEYKKII